MTRIIQRHDTAANWTSVNPTLSQGEFGVETDTGKFKIGDGQTAWNSLPYASSGGTGGSGTQITSADGSVKYGELALGDTLAVANGVLNANLDEIGNEVNTLAGRVTTVEGEVANKQDKFRTVSPIALDTISYNVEAASLIDDTRFKYYVDAWNTNAPEHPVSISGTTELILPTKEAGSGKLDRSKVLYYVGDLKNAIAYMPMYSSSYTLDRTARSMIVGKLLPDDTFIPKYAMGPRRANYVNASYSLGAYTSGSMTGTKWTFSNATSFGASESGFWDKLTQIDILQNKNGYPYTKAIYRSAETGSITKSDVYGTITTDMSFDQFAEEVNCVIFDVKYNVNYNISDLYITKDGANIWNVGYRSEDKYLQLNVGDGLSVVDGKLTATSSGGSEGPEYYSFLDSKYNTNFINSPLWLLSNNQPYNKSDYSTVYETLVSEYNNPTKLKQTHNMDIKKGTLTIKDCVVSGFSSDNYAYVPTVPENVTSYEWVVKFTTKTVRMAPNGQQGLLANSITNKCCPQIFISADTFQLKFLHSLDANTWSTELATGPLSENTTYHAKAIWDGATFSFYYKLDGASDWTLVGTGEAPTLYWVEPVGIGIDAPNLPFEGSIDLKETYININGKRWWNGASAVKDVENPRDIPSDYAFKINRTNETFILPIKNYTDGDNNPELKLYYYIGSTSSGAMGMMRLTQAEYDALATKDDNTMYIIIG